MRALLAALLLLAGPALAADLPEVPDDALTPGAVATTDLGKICEDGYSKTVRHTSAALKAEIYREYNVDKRAVHAEVDHRLPLVLGGADARENLWVQDFDSHPWNAHLKDHLEVTVRTMVCAGKISVQDGQAVFLGDWRVGYRKYIGDPTELR